MCDFESRKVRGRFKKKRMRTPVFASRDARLKVVVQTPAPCPAGMEPARHAPLSPARPRRLWRGGGVHPGVQGVFPAGAAPQGSVGGGQRTGGHRGTVGAARRTEFSLARSLRSLFLGDSLPLDSRPSLVSHYNASPHIRFISVYALCYTISTCRRREEKKKKVKELPENSERFSRRLART